MYVLNEPVKSSIHKKNCYSNHEPHIRSSSVRLSDTFHLIPQVCFVACCAAMDCAYLWTLFDGVHLEAQ